MAGIVTHLWRLKNSCLDALSSRITHWTKPLGTSLPLATLTDLGRSKSELIAENALLRQQLIVLKRQVKRPTFRRTDRILLCWLLRTSVHNIHRFIRTDVLSSQHSRKIAEAQAQLTERNNQ